MNHSESSAFRVVFFVSGDKLPRKVVLSKGSFFLTHTLTHTGKIAESAGEKRFAFLRHSFSFLCLAVQIL